MPDGAWGGWVGGGCDVLFLCIFFSESCVFGWGAFPPRFAPLFLYVKVFYYNH